MHRKRRLREPVKIHRRRQTALRAGSLLCVFTSGVSQAFLRRVPASMIGVTIKSRHNHHAGNQIVTAKARALLAPQRRVSASTMSYQKSFPRSNNNAIAKLSPQISVLALSTGTVEWHTNIRQFLKILTSVWRIHFLGTKVHKGDSLFVRYKAHAADASIPVQPFETSQSRKSPPIPEECIWRQTTCLVFVPPAHNGRCAITKRANPT